MGYYNSFLIKVWTDDSHNLLRGYIQHATTEEIAYFLNWEKMLDFIISHLNWHLSNEDYLAIEEITSRLTDYHENK